MIAVLHKNKFLMGCCNSEVANMVLPSLRKFIIEQEIDDDHDLELKDFADDEFDKFNNDIDELVQIRYSHPICDTVVAYARGEDVYDACTDRLEEDALHTGHDGLSESVGEEYEGF